MNSLFISVFMYALFFTFEYEEIFMNIFDSKINSNLHPMDYYAKDVARIINPKQQTLYIKHKVYPIDIYTSIDERTGNDITVMIFLKEESSEVYRAWCNHELE